MSLLDKKTIELGDGVFVDVMPDAEDVNVRVGDSKGVRVKKVDLWAACFAIADAKTQELLLPVRQTEMSTFIRVHKVKVKRDIKAGQVLTFHCKVSVPQVIEEGLAGSLRKKRSSIVIPR
jgi:hypothetical protein